MPNPYKNHSAIVVDVERTSKPEEEQTAAHMDTTAMALAVELHSVRDSSSLAVD